MLKLLLSERISPNVASGLRRRARGIVVHALAEWEGGNYLAREEVSCLKEAARQRLTFVTYDRLTIPPLLKAWADEECASGECSHGGFVFIDEKSIPPAETAGLVLALAMLAKVAERWDWTDRVCFLRGGGSSFVLKDGVRGIPPFPQKQEPGEGGAPDLQYP